MLLRNEIFVAAKTDFQNIWPRHHENHSTITWEVIIGETP